MSRRRSGDHVDGVVLLDKPAGPSSNQALQRVRRLFNARKAGHTGTLDPFATGMLPICLGEASKTSGHLLDATKTYRATARFGAATTTGDPEGEMVTRGPVPRLDRDELEAVLARFTGELEQVPPMYSALKHEGKPLYEWARQGITVPRKARPVTIHSLRLLEWHPPEMSFEVVCSKGTYIRTLAEDIAAALGTVAHLRELRRLAVSPFEPEAMVTLEALEGAAAVGDLGRHLLPVDAGLVGWPVVGLDEAGARAFLNGNPAPFTARGEAGQGDAVRVRDGQGRALGLGEISGSLVQPRKVFRQPDGSPS